ncbi:STAS domain-containing protein [Lignipirellula cremea]|uniref:STAS domain-containing protein n=1 Tax=Lignipirellula cremea TaxID=2528010 RepID=A0A518DXX8_9BACT|nr:STAS domain-containing protein [Lignipirellula cremea]QDU96700.1 hypothetical protein Pla8534_45210 [Lignipirellula cremea]
MSQNALRVSRTDSGYVVHIPCRGTMRESHAMHAFADSVVREICSLTINLQDCNYLDSTFLGCLVAFQRRLGCVDGEPRLKLAASPAKVKQLLDPLKLSQLFQRVDDAPPTMGHEVELPASTPGGCDFAQHVMECHRQLASIEGPNQAMFAKITEKMAAELEQKNG